MQASIFDIQPDHNCQTLPQPEQLFSFRAIVYSDLDKWTTKALSICSTKEIRTLCLIIGIPHSGDRNKILSRLVDSAALQYRLRRYDRNPEQQHTVQQIQTLASALSGEELKELCKVAAIYAPSTKYGKAAALIKWRRACRRNGVDFVNQARQNAKDNPQDKQTMLF